MRLAIMLVAASLLLPATASAQRASFEELQTFSAVLNLIRLNHVDTVSYGPLVRAGIAGALAAVDPHSRYVRRETAGVLMAIESGELPTSGLRLERIGDIHTVMAVGRGGPGEVAGFLAGDRIVAVRDTPVAGLSEDEVLVRLARGPREFGVGIERGAHAAPQRATLQLRPQRFEWPVIAAELMVAPDIGLIRLAEFNSRASDDVKSAIDRLRRQGAERLILDLRQNPGGLVIEAVEVAALFLPRGTEVFRTVGRKTDTNAEFKTRGGPRFADLPLMLMVDGSTASAAEALAASLRDHDRARIVGHRTFGKALVQAPFPLPAGDVLWLTIARVVSPGGEMIQRSYDDLSAAQYRAMAADLYRGGERIGAGMTGGVAPHTYLDERSDVPPWYTEALERHIHRPILDALPADMTLDPGDDAPWHALLLQPLMAAARGAGITTATGAPAQQRTLARHLAVQATASRSGPEAAAVFFIRSDPEVARAVQEFR
ncbi:MAG TPA: S41 family peptidase [Longimicrobiales bacterium]|nr:S41 family peptidase [Longimicrobiales bacterium]